MPQTCRLCLKSVQPINNEYISVNQTDSNGIAIATLAKALVPELYLGLSANPIVCQSCYDALRDAYSFRLKCLRSENLIGIFMRETHCKTISISLQDVVDYWLNLYRTKPCQSAVARDNLAEWFGVKETEESLRKKWHTGGRRELTTVEATNKNDNSQTQSAVGETDFEKGDKSDSDKPSQTGDTQSQSNPNKQTTVNKITKPNDSKKLLSVAATKSSLYPCDCRQVDYCPTSEHFKYRVSFQYQRVNEEQHKGCFGLCQYRHLEVCPNFKTQGLPPIAYKTVEDGMMVYSIQNTEQTSGADDPQTSSSKDSEAIDTATLLKLINKKGNMEKLLAASDEIRIGDTHLLRRFVNKSNDSFIYSYAIVPKSHFGKNYGSVQREKKDTPEISCTSQAREINLEKEVNSGSSQSETVTTISNKPAIQESSAKQIPTAKKDEESLGNIFTPDQSQSKPIPERPLIRVRPVSSLQAVRTLNHELFLTPPEVNKMPEAPVVLMPPAPMLDPVVLMPPAKMPDPVVLTAPKGYGGSPVLLNSIVVSKINQPLLSLPESVKQPLRSQSPPLLLARPRKKSPKYTYSKNKATVRPTKVSADHVKKMGVDHKQVTKLKKVANEDVREPSSGAGLDILDNTMTEYLEDVIDIKEEPLDFQDSDLLSELDQFEFVSNGSDNWDGETTRSASETSLSELIISDNLSQLIDNIPVVGEDEFDEPEYVQINNVTFEDLAKLMKESQQMELKQQITSNEAQFELTEENSSGPSVFEQVMALYPKRSRTKRAAGFPRHASKSGLPFLAPKPGLSEGVECVVKSARVPKKKAGKRLRLVPVDEGEVVLPKKKRKSCISDPRTVCVLFTSYSQDGDYINDHDYLVGPYRRNNMVVCKEDGERCLCLICGWFFPSIYYIYHMRQHTTRCFLCQADFFNVFVLNLHVRCHTLWCNDCSVEVTYSKYRKHAKLHNQSPILSNIKIPRAERFPMSMLKKICNACPEGLRRMTKNSRTRNYENVELEEEEACIYDKATKSFITPSLDEQQKMLATCPKKVTENIAEEATNAEPVDDTNSSEFITLERLLSKPLNLSSSDTLQDNNQPSPKKKTRIIKKVKKEKEANPTDDSPSENRFITLKSLLSDSEPADSNVSVTLADNQLKSDATGKLVSQKPPKSPKKRRRLFSLKPRKKIIGQNTKVTNEQTEKLASESDAKETSLKKPGCSSNAPRGSSANTRVTKNTRPQAIIKKLYALKPETLKKLPQTTTLLKRTLLKRTHEKKLNPKSEESEPKPSRSKKNKSPVRVTKDVSELIESIQSESVCEKKKEKNQDDVINQEVSKSPLVINDMIEQVVLSNLSPFGTRSSRSRGNSNLVEGLKIDGPIRPKKSRKVDLSPEKYYSKQDTRESEELLMEIKSEVDEPIIDSQRAINNKE